MTRVLIIEDEESYREATAFMLRQEGFEVAEAGDGRAGLSEFDHNGADIVLLALNARHTGYRGVPSAAAAQFGGHHHGHRA